MESACVDLRLPRTDPHCGLSSLPDGTVSARESTPILTEFFQKRFWHYDGGPRSTWLVFPTKPRFRG